MARRNVLVIVKATLVTIAGATTDMPHVFHTGPVTIARGSVYTTRIGGTASISVASHRANGTLIVDACSFSIARGFLDFARIGGTGAIAIARRSFDLWGKITITRLVSIARKGGNRAVVVHASIVTIASIAKEKKIL